MVKINVFYDMDSSKLVIEYKNNLLVNHSELFTKLVSEIISPSKNIETIKNNDNNYSIKIPYTIPEEAKSMGKGVIDKNLAKKIETLINSFTNKALLSETKRYEFLPLNEYNVEDFKSDIENAIKERRDFCIINDFNSYKEFPKRNFRLLQATYEYMSDKYCDIAILGKQGKIEEIKKEVSEDMKEIDWM